ncbi:MULTISPECIES: hypothetical protein [unclassified Lentilitoribacter]|jgi:hypothetical protein|uniref:hypothetical protein n=1 Tax=unclassified Lentilitoribacter TaxID=2647570 RepID=UPI0013A6CBE4|nr:hypothetical protein [Lentilitoribacter sp. Alg239-R112]
MSARSPTRQIKRKAKGFKIRIGEGEIISEYYREEEFDGLDAKHVPEDTQVSKSSILNNPWVIGILIAIIF